MTTLDLQSACKTGEMQKIQQAFFQNPSKLNEKDSQVIVTQLGWTPLYRTVTSGRLEAARFLLDQGADPNTTNNLGETPLHQAADSENYSMAKLLLDFGAEVNAQQNEGDTPLHHSAFRGDLDMVELLLEYNADPNLSNKVVNNSQTGRSPLHYAVDCGYLECVLSMVRSSADPYLCDSTGKNAFDMTKDPQILIALTGKPKSEKPETLNCGDTLSERDCESVLDGECDFKKLAQDFSKITTQPATAVTSLKACKSDLFPIYDWLSQHSLDDYYEMVKAQGFFSVEDILANPEGLKSGILPNIHKPGHSDRFVFRLTEEGYKKDAKILHKKSKSSFLRCCGISSSNNQGLFYTPDLKKWLSDIHMEVYFKNFVDAGYDDIDALIIMADSHLGLNKEKLAKIGILNDKHVLKVLRKLDKDNANIYSRNSVGRISFDEPKTVACESCVIT